MEKRGNHESVGGVQIVIAGLFILSGVAVGFAFGVMIPPNGYHRSLTAIVGAQASILAIVISVTLISTQIVAMRYAPRMATLPFQSSSFKQVFFLFAVSIILDIILLTGPTFENYQAYSALAMGAIFLFIVVLGSLFRFVPNMLSLSTPENLIALFVQQLTPSKYLRETRELSNNTTQRTHPLQPLYRYIMSTISKEEFGTSQNALEEYSRFSMDTLNQLDERGAFETEDNRVAKELFGPVLKDQLHEITIHAAENEEYSLKKETVDCQRHLGFRGMQVNDGRPVPGQSLAGIRKTIMDCPVHSEDYSTFNIAWKSVGKLMHEESGYEQRVVSLSGSNLISQRLQMSMERMEDVGWYSDSMRELFYDLCAGYARALGQLNQRTDLSKVNWRQDPWTGDMPSPDLVASVNDYRNAIIAATDVFLHYRIQDGQYPITEGNFRQNWKDICIVTYALGATELTEMWCENLLELAFLETVNGPFDRYSPFGPTGPENNVQRLYWSSEIASVREETGDIMEETFQNLLSFNRMEEPPPIFIMPDQEDLEEKYLRPEFSTNDIGAINAHADFPDLIIEFQENTYT